MIVLYLAIAVVMLTLGTQLLLGNVTHELGQPELIPISTELDGAYGHDR